MAETIQAYLGENKDLPGLSKLYQYGTSFIHYTSDSFHLLYRFGPVSVKGSMVHQKPQWTRNHLNFVFLICKHWRFYLITFWLNILEFMGGFLRVTALQAVISGLG